MPLITLRIASVISGNVLAGQENVGAAMSLNMIVICGVVMADLPPPACEERAMAVLTRLARVRWWRVVVLLVLGVYFFGPLAAAFTFTIHNPRLHTYSFAPYGQMFGAAGLRCQPPDDPLDRRC